MKNAVHDFRAETVLKADLKGVRSRKALLEALAVGLKLPRHFGHNWDALADCLMDENWAKGPAEAGITVLLLDSKGGEKRFGDDWATLLDILDEACIWWGEKDRAFRVVLA